MRLGDKFGPVDLSVKAVKLFRPVTGIKTKKCYMQLLGLNPNGNGYVFVSRWESGKVRPGTRYLRRMVRLRLWADEGWPVDRLLSVDWLGMSMQWSDESDRNLFHLSAHTLFPFGSLRDGAQILRDTMQFHGIVHRSHMCRLLGLDPRRQYNTLYRWFHRLRELGPKYLLRLLLLLLWAGEGYELAAIWSIDWEARTVEWVRGAKPVGSRALPLNPFEMLVPGGKVKTKTARKPRRTRDTGVVRLDSPFNRARPVKTASGLAPVSIPSPLPVAAG